ncbi:class I SAM-dependent methyltransferase [Tenacibaculum aquimarinum]|uniref:class I SAM-dependent methyltransferase n=1 Tax=Tenacibaculum aquimarinum TaxID=2910675 RepID=UPI001F0B45EE|nr:class I SAM-dependent methyltransferase [Tenacibaculum aquimarinum]MCH3884046.1 class I SAM-dependent methyltransferase [Tenacibaculum aquimarinum]
MDIQKEIIRITSEYFQDKLDYKKLQQASQEYKSLLNSICGQNMDVENGKKDINLNNGKALGTFWAALCLDDLIRTRKFIRGIDKAIRENINKQKPLHILYAGTGPFATLILPTIFRYSKEEIKYTFIELNPFSFEILQTVISKLELENFNINFVKEDATKYQIDAKNKPDIIISETMQNALAKEQQVSIFLNLMNQVNYKSIFIPEKIELFIALKKAGIPAEETLISHYQNEKKVFEVSKEAMIPLNRLENNTSYETSFTKKQITIAQKELKGFSRLVLLTKIKVYKDEKIEINESGLTVPLIIKDIQSNFEGSLTINTQYKISSHPKLEYEIILNNKT